MIGEEDMDKFYQVHSIYKQTYSKNGNENTKESTIIKAHVPGSKSITNRALLIAALSDGKSHLKHALFSDDSKYFLSSLQSLGFLVESCEETEEITITGFGGKIPKKKAEIYVGSAGTAARFLTALLGLSDGEYQILASKQMQKRPMKSLFDALTSLGAKIEYQGSEGFLPIQIGNKEITQTEVTVDIDKSSQFLSALLMVSPLFQHGLKIHVTGNHGMAYIELTIKMMKQFGVYVDRKENTFIVPANQKYQARDYEIEPDISAACYFYAMAPLLQRRVQVRNVHTQALQGDIAFLSVLVQMGAKMVEESDGIIMEGTGELHGVCADLSACSDQTMTLAALAVFADSETKITGIGHIRFQESNRIEAVKTELCRMGIVCEEIENGLRIKPGMPKPAQIETYEDHRMAMGFTLIGLRADGIVIKDPDCCAKTFVNYFDELERVLYIR